MIVLALGWIPGFQATQVPPFRRMTPTQSPGMPAVATPAMEAGGGRGERWAVGLILGVFVAVGFNHIHSNALFGQDFDLHARATELLRQDSSKWFPLEFTNRPLIYGLGAAGHWLTHGKAPYELAAVICVLLNALALYFAHDSTRRFITSPWLRISAVAFIAFLPATQVAAVVYAEDAVGPLPFTLAAWGLLRSLASVSARASAGYAVLAGLALCAGSFAKFLFMLQPLAGAGAIALAWRWRRISWKRGVTIGALALLAPIITGGWIQLRAERHFAGVPKHHSFAWPGTGEMTWADLLLVKPSDRRILAAPGYWDIVMINGQHEYALSQRHDYSYPALLHLGIYTDVLDYAGGGQLHDLPPRPEPQKTLSRWAVRLGLLTSVGIFLAVLALVARSAAALVTPRLAPANGVLVWGLMALAWYLPLFLSFPFLHHVYEWGYWLPRLVIPALWGFGLLFFAAVDGLLAPHRRLPALLACLIIIQAALHIRSVWY